MLLLLKTLIFTREVSRKDMKQLLRVTNSHECKTNKSRHLHECFPPEDLACRTMCRGVLLRIDNLTSHGNHVRLWANQRQQLERYCTVVRKGIGDGSHPVLASAILSEDGENSRIPDY